MSFWKFIGIAYTVVSWAVTLYWFVGFVLEDIRMYRDPIRKSLSKFGYNLKWGGVGWWFLFATLPGINLLLVYVFIVNHDPYLYISKKVKKLCSQRNQQ